MSDIRSDPATIDGPWLTDALEANGVARGATVLDVASQGFVGTGQAGRVARLELHWDEPLGRPGTVMVKIPSADPAAKAAMFGSGTYLREFVFYRELAHLVDVRSPRCYFAEYDDEAQEFVLILEDIHGTAAGDQLTGLSTDQVALAIGQAVKLHVPRWGDPAMEAVVSAGQTVRSAEDRAALTQAVYALALPGFLDRLGGEVDSEIIDLIQRFGPRVGELFYTTDTPDTLVHNDFRADNLLFGHTASAPAVAVVDYQAVSVGFGAGDISYLVGGSFADPSHRAACERDLVTDYHAELQSSGVAISFDAVWRDYRVGSLWGVLSVVAASLMAEKTDRGETMLVALAQRHGHQALDLEALDVLGRCAPRA